MTGYDKMALKGLADEGFEVGWAGEVNIWIGANLDEGILDPMREHSKCTFLFYCYVILMYNIIKYKILK